MWISCTTVLHRWGMAFPVYLCTPISVIVCGVLLAYSPSSVFHFKDGDMYYLELLLVGALLWIGLMMIMGFFIWDKKNKILSKDEGMFLTPHYNGVFLEQYMILNRQGKKGKKSKATAIPINSDDRPRTIFICSTMYRENDEEMKQILSSIYNLACHCRDKKERDPEYKDHYESHLFLDGGINGFQLTYFALQLFSLLEESLHINSKAFQKIYTPYGCQLSWDIADSVPFYIHLKDNFKVKNKKRWSQVMYMNYVLNFRIKRNIHNLRNGRELKRAPFDPYEGSVLDDENTFILITDADIQFTPESAIMLLDRLVADPQIGAVCARTFPQGSGPVYWYQVFEYAIGHWFQKAAEDIIGTVLCCPGCFSAYRCTALRSILDAYSTEVSSAIDFLTKDMGEDRWLCTLLVENGWRLNYCAISENHTHCPETIDEFFKQRRRWIPSTMANLTLLISQASKIVKGNNWISVLFIIYEAFMVFTTIISPATMIIVISAGVNSAFGTGIGSIEIVLLIFCMIYALLCLYGDPQLQLDVTKLCILFFSVLMGVVVAGYIKSIMKDIITIARKSDSNIFHTPSTFYLLIFVLIFILAAMLHPNEWYCILHFVWYLLALPSGCILLLIYSSANLDNRSWGTREGTPEGQVRLYRSIASFLCKVWTRLMLCADQCTCRPVILHKQEDAPSSSSSESGASKLIVAVDEGEFKLNAAVLEWLDQHECGQYAQKFEQAGYFTLHFIADMKTEDFIEIGIIDKGYRLRLEREAKRLPSLPLYREIPDDVVHWLQRLELQGYRRIFALHGYKGKGDLESIKELTLEDLKSMGIHKKAHQKRILEGVTRLAYPTAIEIKISQSKSILENEGIQQAVEEGNFEMQFWIELVNTTLQPMKMTFVSDTELKYKLKSLRNSILCVMFVITITWLALMYIPNFVDPKDIILSQPTELVFLFLFLVILLIQFVAMIIHRCATLVHYLARIGPEDKIET